MNEIPPRWLLWLGAALAASSPGVAAADEGVPQSGPAVADERLSLGMRLHARYEYEDEAPEHELELVRARFFADFAPAPWLTGQLDVDIAEVPVIKDAYADAALRPYLHFVAGQLKKPFSRVELLSSGKLPLATRGLVNSRLVSDTGFGGRDIGVMLWGEVGLATYALGAFNGTMTAPEVDTAKDVAGRLELALTEAVELGASGSLIQKNPDIPGYEPWHASAVGLDARLRLGPVDATFEGIYAQAPIAGVSLEQAGGIAYAVVKTPRLFGVSARPIVKVEVFDADTSRSGDLTWAYLGGVNFDFKEPLRILVQAEQRVPESGSSSTAVFVQLALDAKIDLAVVPRRAE